MSYFVICQIWYSCSFAKTSFVFISISFYLFVFIAIISIFSYPVGCCRTVKVGRGEKYSEHFENFAAGNFFTGWWKPEEESFLQFEPSSKLKTAFCEYWTSIKIKLTMTCVKLKQKWYRSNDCSWKWRFYWVITGNFSRCVGRWTHFWLVESDSPHLPSRENPKKQHAHKVSNL